MAKPGTPESKQMSRRVQFLLEEITILYSQAHLPDVAESNLAELGPWDLNAQTVRRRCNLSDGRHRHTLVLPQPLPHPSIRSLSILLFDTDKFSVRTDRCSFTKDAHLHYYLDGSQLLDTIGMPFVN